MIFFNIHLQGKLIVSNLLHADEDEEFSITLGRRRHELASWF